MRRQGVLSAENEGRIINNKELTFDGTLRVNAGGTLTNNVGGTINKGQSGVFTVNEGGTVSDYTEE